MVLQGAAWVALLASSLAERGGWLDRALSTGSMAGLAASLALSAAAFERWCGRTNPARGQMLLAVVVPLGYGIGFSSYAFRVGWANFGLALQMALIVVAMVRRPAVPVGRWRWLLLAAFAAQSVVTFGRGVLGGFFAASFPTFLTPHPVNVAFALVANATAMLSLMAVLLAHRDEAARELERLATVDGLTGVLNRRAWMARASDALAVGVRHDHPVAVLMIDVDHFKAINDRLGHDAGDRALAFLAGTLQAALRPGDLVGRYGGEEFCILMDHADAAAARAFDARMRAALGASALHELGFPLAYSAGIAMRGATGDTLEAMLRRADANLYGAKAQGRSRTLDAEGVRLRVVA